MNIKLHWLLWIILGMNICTTVVQAQTNPAAVTLPFTLSAQYSAALPAGVAVHRFSSIPTTRTPNPATGDLPAQSSTPTGNAGGWYYLGENGIGLLASGTNPAGALVVSVSTLGQSGIQVSWLCRTIYNQASRDNSIALQYRIGNSGNFTNIGTSSTYSSSGNANGHSSALFTEMLPAAAENQAEVQLRWIYWESVSTSGSRDKIAVDEISINGAAVVNCPAPSGLSVSTVSDSAAGFSWHTDSNSHNYEIAVTATTDTPLSGMAISDTTYTISGLNPGTPYAVYLRRKCDTGVYSEWIVSTFTTGTGTPAVDSNIMVMSYNLLNYPGSTADVRDPAFRVVLGAVQPDVLVVQELSSLTGFNRYLNNVLNYDSVTYSGGTFINGPDSDNGIYFKTAKFQFVSNTPIATALRDINEFKLRHLATGDTLIFYSAHLKASNTSADALSREAEVANLRSVTNTMDAGKYFMVCGDFNFYSSYEGAYQKLVQAGAYPNGKFNDVVNMSGNWNNAAYAIHHTQSPRTTAFGGGATGGMDDRFDMILFSDALMAGSGTYGLEANSYKAYGNDGLHYNQALNTPPYGMYTSTITAALHDASDHIPVVVKLKYSHSAINTQSAPLSYTQSTTVPLIALYPNPVQEMLYLEVAKGSLKGNVSLFDATGRQVWGGRLSGQMEERLSIDLSGIPSGFYYLKIEGHKDTYKVIRK